MQLQVFQLKHYLTIGCASLDHYLPQQGLHMPIKIDASVILSFPRMRGVSV
jgi:hypothetical protein